MPALATHTKANREFFAKGCGFSKAKWRALVEDKTVQGKLVGNDVLIDLNHFAAHDKLETPRPKVRSGLELLA